MTFHFRFKRSCLNSQLEMFKYNTLSTQIYLRTQISQIAVLLACNAPTTMNAMRGEIT